MPRVHNAGMLGNVNALMQGRLATFQGLGRGVSTIETWLRSADYRTAFGRYSYG